MKIGKFAQLFERNKTCIRHYTNIGLLLPEKSGTYPDYDDKCIEDMKEIIKFIDMGFTLEEILKIITFKRYTGIYVEEEKKALIKLIDTRRECNNREIKELQRREEELTSFREELKRKGSKKGIKGMSLRECDRIKCPICGEKAPINGATIYAGAVIEGCILCSCGEELKIKEGMIHTDEPEMKSVFEVYDNKKKVDVHNDIISPQSMGIVRDTAKYLKENIKRWNHEEGVLFLNADSDIIMMEIHKEFHAGGVYIFHGSHRPSMELLKSRIEELELCGEFIFIVGREKIPVEGVTYVVDNCPNGCDILTDSEIGSGMEYTEFSRDIKEIILVLMTGDPWNEHEKYKGYLKKESYDFKMKEIGFNFVSGKKVGPLIRTEGFYPMLKSKELYFDIDIYKREKLRTK